MTAVRRPRRQRESEGDEKEFDRGRRDGTSMFGARGRKEYDDAREARGKAREDREARRSGRSRRDEEEADDGYSHDPSGRGWGDAKRMKEQTSRFAPRLKFVLDEENVIRVLQPEPAKTWIQHYLPVIKRSLPCLEVVKGREIVQSCPLCDAGDDDRKMYGAFNIVVLVQNGDILEEPEVKLLRTPPSLLDKLEEIHNSRKGPIDEVYLEITAFKKSNDFQDYKVSVLKDRDLEDDWKIEPLTEDDLEIFREEVVEEKDILYFPSKQEYAEAVAKLSSR